MTTKHQSPAVYDRRATMRKAHREYAASCRRGDGLTFGYWLAYAWRIARNRRQRDMTDTTMRMIAGMIEDHLSRRIVLAPAIEEGTKHNSIPLGFRLSSVSRHRTSRDGRRAICQH